MDYMRFIYLSNNLCRLEYIIESFPSHLSTRKRLSSRLSGCLPQNLGQNLGESSGRVFLGPAPLPILSPRGTIYPFEESRTIFSFSRYDNKTFSTAIYNQFTLIRNIVTQDCKHLRTKEYTGSGVRQYEFLASRADPEPHSSAFAKTLQQSGARAARAACPSVPRITDGLLMSH